MDALGGRGLIMYRTSDKKRDSLENCGFTLSNEPSTTKDSYTDITVCMEVWTNLDQVRLYIHFDDTDKPDYCNLYLSENDSNVQYFSERNLISELKKRGFNALSNIK